MIKFAQTELKNLLTAVNMVGAGEWDDGYGERPDWEALASRIQGEIKPLKLIWRRAEVGYITSWDGGTAQVYAISIGTTTHVWHYVIRYDNKEGDKGSIHSKHLACKAVERIIKERESQ